VNEAELRYAFVNFINSKRPTRFCFDSWADKNRGPCDVVVAKEADYGSFDLVLFIRFGGVIYDVVPVELKSDEDKLDDRLRNQICSALLTFGKSILVLDEKQFEKAKKLRWPEVLPCEIWFRKCSEFEQATSQVDFGRSAKNSCDISQRAIEQAFGHTEQSTLRRLQKKVVLLQRFLATLEANQWRFNNPIKFSKEEAEVARELLGVQILEKFVQTRLV
jgi:hypothetical protein